MKRIWIMLGVVGITITACNRENKSSEKENKVPNRATANTATTTKNDYETEYQDRSQRMATNLNFKNATAAKLQGQDEERRKYSYSNEANVRAGGNAAATNHNTSNNPSLQEDIQMVNGPGRGELGHILIPDFYKAYQSNPSGYFSVARSGDNINREISHDKDEVTVQTGDIKVKAEPGKSKVETATYESKIKGNERKYKSKTSDTKIKSEPGKAKYESGDTKIKVKTKE